MKELPQTEDWLDMRLRDAAPYIDDAGFTGRVMKQLPRRHALRTQRTIIILTATIVSVVIAYFGSGEGWFVREALVRAATLPPLTVLGFISRQRGPKTDVVEAMMQDAVKPGFDKVNTVGRELLTMRTQIRGRETKLPAEPRSLLHCS